MSNKYDLSHPKHRCRDAEGGQGLFLRATRIRLNSEQQTRNMACQVFHPAFILRCFLEQSFIPQGFANACSESDFLLRVQRWCRCGPEGKHHNTMTISWLPTPGLAFSAFWEASHCRRTLRAAAKMLPWLLVGGSASPMAHLCHEAAWGGTEGEPVGGWPAKLALCRRELECSSSPAPADES